MTRIRRLAYAILDGTLIPIDRVAALPGAAHDLNAVPAAALPRHLTSSRAVRSTSGQSFRASTRRGAGRPEIDFDDQSAEQVRRQHRSPSDLGA